MITEAASRLLKTQTRRQLAEAKALASRRRADEARHVKVALLGKLANSPEAANVADSSQVERAAEAIRKAGLFDEEFYLSQLGEAIPIEPTADPLGHYLHIGWKLLLDPTPLFSVTYYLLRYPDVLESNFEPLSHYVSSGSLEMRDPHPLFLNYHYVSQLDGNLEGTPTVLSVALLNGERPGGPSPHPLFELGEFNDLNGLQLQSPIVALLEYIKAGSSTLKLSVLFDSEFYKSQFFDYDGATCVYEHYATYGVLQCASPSPFFDAQHYRSQVPEWDNTLDPLLHYLWKGEAEGNSPHPFFSPEFYASRRNAGSASQRLRHFVRIGIIQGTLPHKDFPAEVMRVSAAPAERIDAVVSLFADGVLTGAVDGVLSGGATHAPSPSYPPMLSSAIKGAGLPMPVMSTPTHQEFDGAKTHANERRTIILVAHFVGSELFGSERSFIDMLSALSAVPFNIVAILPKNNPSYTALVRTYCTHVYIREYGWWRNGEKICEEWVGKFTSILDRERPDAIHVNTIMLREPAVAARRLGIPVVIHVRELIEYDTQLCVVIGEQPSEIQRQVSELADWIVANSEATSQAYLSSGKCVVIPNTVDVAHLSLTPERVGQPLAVGIISSNVAKKGIVEFTQLAVQCYIHNPEISFLVFGPETTLIKDIKQRLIDDGSGHNIEFMGYAQNATEALKEIDVLVSLSKFAESFGRTALEAMAAGKIVIAYDWGALPELIEHERTGFLIPYMEAGQAVEPILELASNVQARSRLSGAAKLKADGYDISQYKKRIGKFYDQVFEGAPRKEREPAILRARAWEGRNASEVLRLAYFCWHFPVPSETFVLNELEELVNAGVDVMVFCKESPHKNFSPGFPIVWHRVKSAEDLASGLIKHQRNMVHAHFVYPTVTNIVWPACEIAKVRFTFIAHAQDIFKYENADRARLNEIGKSDQCLRLFTLSAFHYDYVLSLGFPREKISINPNAVNADRFKFSPRNHLGGPLRIISIGRFVEKKGLRDVIAAATLLTDLNIAFELYGYGELEDEFRGQIADLGVSNVTIHGPLSQAEVVEVMGGAAAFIAPSVRTATGDMDGIPTTLIESMLTGLPVIATGVAGIPDLVLDGVTGFVSEEGPAGIAATVRRFVATERLELRAIILAARERAQRNHDVKKTVKVLERVWRNEPVDVVVVSWNHIAELRVVIDRILSFTASPLHLIICDNDSRKEDVQTLLKELWTLDDRVTIILNPVNEYVGPATNRAAMEGWGRQIIYVCAKEGVSFRSGWERPFIEALEADGRIGMVGSLGYSPTYLTGGGYQTGVPLFSQFRNQEFARKNESREFWHIQGGLFGMSRQMFSEIGGFSYSVPHSYTDVEYSYYVESMGWGLGEAFGVSAYFNKTRPSLSQRFSEDTVVAHPVLPGDVYKYEQLRSGQLKHCNVCDWYGPRFSAGICPACLSDGFDRTFHCWLADTNLMYRRVPALGVGLSHSLTLLWKKQFQGPCLSVNEFEEVVREAGRLPNRTGGLAFAYMRTKATPGCDAELIANECGRLIKPGGQFALQLTNYSADEWDAASAQWSQWANGAGFVELNVTSYSRASMELDYRPLRVFAKVKR